MLRLYTRDPEYCLLTEKRSPARNNLHPILNILCVWYSPWPTGFPHWGICEDGLYLERWKRRIYLIHAHIIKFEYEKLSKSGPPTAWIIVDWLCVCEGCWSVYISNVMPGVLSELQTRNKAYEFSAQWFIRHFVGPCCFSDLYSYAEHQVLQFFSHSLLSNHHCKYAAMSSWVILIIVPPPFVRNFFHQATQTAYIVIGSLCR